MNGWTNVLQILKHRLRKDVQAMLGQILDRVDSAVEDQKAESLGYPLRLGAKWGPIILCFQQTL